MKGKEEVLRLLSYGLYIIGSKSEAKLNGQVANTLMQVTSEPPRVVFALNKRNLTHDLVKASGLFSASVLSKDCPMDLIARFGFKSGKEVDKFAGVVYKYAGNGCPVLLEHTLGYLAGKVILDLDAGTHTVFLGEVEEGDVLSSGEPMTYAYYHQVKKGGIPSTAPLYRKKVEEGGIMKKYVCSVCGYVYDPNQGDPERGISPGTAFEDLPEDWVCPICGASKDQFTAED